MTFEELMEQEPELAAEVQDMVAAARNDGREEGIASERERIMQIDSIAASIPADMVEAAKYSNVKDAASLALELAQKNAAAGQQYMRDAVDDARDSGTEEVQTNPVDNEEEDAVENQLVNGAAGNRHKR